MRRFVTVAVLVVIALGLQSCSHTSARTAGRLTVSGHARVTLGSGATVTVTKTRTIKSGDRVEIVDGTAQLGLGDGRELQLRKGSVVQLAVLPSASGSLQTEGQLVSGDVLVISSGDAATVLAGDTTVQVSGIARVSRGVATVTAVYQGAAGVSTAGKSVSVPALRQVTVPAPGLPSRPTPLVFSASDTWDQRYLGDAIDLGNQLVARSTGFTAQLAPGQGASVTFFRQVLPQLASQPFDASLLTPNRPAGETLVGAAITLAGTKGQFADRWASVFAFHDDGAPWGLVALDQGASRTAVLSIVDGAIARANVGGSQLAAPATGSSGASGSGGTGGTKGATPANTAPANGGGTTTATTVPSGQAGTGAGSTGSSGQPGSTGTGSGGAGSSGSGTASTDNPPRGPLQTGIPVLDDTVRALVDALDGLLSQLGPS